MEKRAVNTPSVCVNMDELVHESATFGRGKGSAKFFYSNAQHACIASYLAEDIYGTETARAIVALFCSDMRAGRISSEIMRQFPCLKFHQDASRLPVFDAFGVDITLLHDRKVRHIVKIMEAVEYRDVRQAAGPDVRVSPPSDVVIAQMTARQSRTAFTLRISELFDAKEIGLDTDKSLRESSLSNILAF